MRKILFTTAILSLATACFASLTINIGSPGSGATVSSPVHLYATASGASRMSVYLDGSDVWDSSGGTLDGWKSVGSGSHTANFKAWDSSGNVYSKSVSFSVGGSTSTSSGSLTINISTPASGSTKSSPVEYKASASGASRMAVYLDGSDIWDSSSGSIDAWKATSGGSHTATFKAWTSSGSVSSKSVSFSVGSTSTGSSSGSTTSSGTTTVYGMQNKSGWNSCSSCAGEGGTGPTASYSLSQFQSSPSLSGSSAKYSITGGSAWAAVLWYHSVIPSSNTSGTNQNTHHFIYDTYFYINKGSVSQALEFDVNQYVNGHQLIWGTQCDIRGGNHWDIYDNQGHKWVSTGIYCPTPSSYTWHHVIVEVARGSGDYLHYVAITLDGNKHYIDSYYPPTSSSWNVSTINFQMDMDGSADTYTVWLDKLNVTYW